MRKEALECAALTDALEPEPPPISVRPLAYAPDSICPSPVIRSENAKK